METEKTDDRLLEPLKAYKQHYEKEFAEHTENKFQELVTESGIDVEANRITVKHYNDELKKISLIDKTLSKMRSVKAFLIVLSVVGGLLFLIGLFSLIGGSYLAGGIMLPLGIALLVSMIVLIVKKIKPILKDNEEKKKEHQQKANALQQEAWGQMAPLNALFDSNMTKQLIEKTIPLLKIDDNFNMRRYDYLSGKYGFGEPDNENRSTIGILTGEILGNPFVIDRELVHHLGTQTYTGSLVITWTTTSVDSKGHVQTHHHSQTLHASISRPAPFYHRETRLIYGNDAAPDLHFSRSPSHAEKLSEKELERKVKSGAKQIQKKQQKAISSGATAFTEMGNSEFDVLFGALNRDNEVQFRLLFTPLAQKNMVALMTDRYAFGDDFEMSKRGPLNFISSEHSASWDMDASYERYFSYSVDLSHDKFVDFNKSYFKSLYFDFAPLLSIPLYQQQKPREYIYQEDYPRNYTAWETECSVNAIGQNAFKPELAGTNAILKTHYLGRNGKSDTVRVTAYSYRTYERVEFVPTLGGDGHIHNVPVPWTEYIPISRERNVTLKEIGLSDREFSNQSLTEAFKETIGKYTKSYSYKHGILCCVTDEDESAFDADFSKIFE